jgi:argininosuccinate lyase
VLRGVAFREAYKAVGRLVALAVQRGIALGEVDEASARAIHPALDAQALRALEPRAAVAAKESVGGTGPRAVSEQIAWLREAAATLEATANTHGSIDDLAQRVFAETLQA